MSKNNDRQGNNHHQNNNSSRKQRSNTLTKLNNILPAPIELNNGESLENHKANHKAHITDVRIGDYHQIKGDYGLSYIVWQIKITINDLDFSSIILYKRYNDLLNFYNELKQKYNNRPQNNNRIINDLENDIDDIIDINNNNLNIIIPNLPPKDSLSFDRFIVSKNWLEERRKGLQWFLSSVLLDPILQNDPIVKKFVLDK
ncbi:YPT35 [Candida pseudojiufengensis]|uniref:YPT35 n=1 Tax=Candida pseudojiufengensis TaxID=497109 RepID=UPI00222437B6|nr:YPT35 [Candida pseudojiufengensis]KAI5964106.1 YPT35 [Candida pseudojiufengensis]